MSEKQKCDLGCDDKDLCNVRIVHQDKVEEARRHALSQDTVERVTAIFKAFGEPGRLQILHALLGREMCVCDLAALLGVSESAISHQLRLLRTLGLVVNRREGPVLYYSIARQRTGALIDLAALMSKDER